MKRMVVIGGLIAVLAGTLVVGGILLSDDTPGNTLGNTPGDTPGYAPGHAAGDTPGDAAGKPKPPPQVRVAAAQSGTISEVVELTGSVEPYRLARLASPAVGPVVKVYVREGDRVAAGERVLALGRKEGADALIASLREELKKEEENLERTRRLVESDALAAEQLDRAQSERERVRAQLVKAEETAADHVLSAPWEGIVSRVMVREGDYLAPRVVLVEIYDPASLVVRASVPERHATRVRERMSVHTTLDAYPGTVLEGRVARVYPYLEERTRTRTFEVALPASAELLPGMFARLRLPLETVTDAVIVPAEAVMATPQTPAGTGEAAASGVAAATRGEAVTAPGETAASRLGPATGSEAGVAGGPADRPTGGPGARGIVYVVADGRVQRRAVRTGIEEDGRVQIVSGVAPGEMVVVMGPGQLKDGAPVRVIAPGKAGGGGGGR